MTGAPKTVYSFFRGEPKIPTITSPVAIPMPTAILLLRFRDALVDPGDLLPDRQRCEHGPRASSSPPTGAPKIPMMLSPMCLSSVPLWRKMMLSRGVK